MSEGSVTICVVLKQASPPMLISELPLRRKEGKIGPYRSLNML